MAEVIKNIQTNANKNVDYVNDTVQSIEKTTQMATISGTSLDEIVKLAMRSADLVRSIEVTT